MAVAVRGALKVSHTVLAANPINTRVKRPSSILIGLISEAAALVHAASELLHSEYAKEQEYKEHEEYGISKVRKRTKKGIDESPHLRERMNGLERPEHAEDSEDSDSGCTFASITELNDA